MGYYVKSVNMVVQIVMIVLYAIHAVVHSFYLITIVLLHVLEKHTLIMVNVHHVILIVHFVMVVMKILVFHVNMD